MKKYVVLKIAEIEALPPSMGFYLAAIFAHIELQRRREGKHHRKFVCIHDGMKCYEQVWKLLEDEVNDNEHN